MIKTIFFDFDGVIAPSKPGGRAIAEKLSLVIGVQEQRIFNAFKKVGRPYLLGKQSPKQFLEMLSKELEKQVKVEDLVKAYYKVPISKQVLKIIEKLKARGHRVELVSNNPSFRFKALKAKGRIDVWKTFHKINISSLAGKMKEEFFQKLPLKEGLFIDNNKEFLERIKKKQGKTIYFDSLKHDLGYLKKKLAKAGIKA